MPLQESDLMLRRDYRVEQLALTQDVTHEVQREGGIDRFVQMVKEELAHQVARHLLDNGLITARVDESNERAMTRITAVCPLVTPAAPASRMEVMGNAIAAMPNVQRDWASTVVLDHSAVTQYPTEPRDPVDLSVGNAASVRIGGRDGSMIVTNIEFIAEDRYATINLTGRMMAEDPISRRLAAEGLRRGEPAVRAASPSLGDPVARYQEPDTSETDGQLEVILADADEERFP